MARSIFGGFGRLGLMKARLAFSRAVAAGIVCFVLRYVVGGVIRELRQQLSVIAINADTVKGVVRGRGEQHLGVATLVRRIVCSWGCLAAALVA
jgi:hypothetical protein